MKNFALGLLSGALAIAIWMLSKEKQPITIENLNEIQNTIKKLKTGDSGSVDLTNTVLSEKTKEEVPKKKKFLGIFGKKNKV